MYDNECIFDRLGCAVSPNGQHIAAGAYGELAVFDAHHHTFSLLKTCVQPFTQNVRELFLLWNVVATLPMPQSLAMNIDGLDGCLTEQFVGPLVFQVCCSVAGV
jgi:hypothetical protein